MSASAADKIAELWDRLTAPLGRQRPTKVGGLVPLLANVAAPAPDGRLPPRTIVVTGCDRRHDRLAADLLASLRAAPDRDFDIGFVRMGADKPPPAITDGLDAYASLPMPGHPLVASRGYDMAYLGLKPQLPELIPGYDLYIWMDGDSWLQNRAGLVELAWAADRADISAVPESDPNYWRSRLPDPKTLRYYAAIYGVAEAENWSGYPMVNAGVFAARADSPLWGLWKAELDGARERQAGDANAIYSDQIPLHRLIASRQISLQPVRAANNWMLCFARPMVDEAAQRLRVPSAPFDEINILHLAGASKDLTYLTTDGRPVSFRYSAIAEFWRRGTKSASRGPRGPAAAATAP